jgi:phage replication-related protein YjqB (UPF0714/DUF867 family)
LADRYRNFADLAASEVDGVDYRIRFVDRPSSILVMAPHGGCIEPTTSEIAAAIAGDDHVLYRFEGLKPERPHADLHLTSRHYDEPQAVAAVAKADIVIVVHGRQDREDPATVWLGGGNRPLRIAMGQSLIAAGFSAITGGHPLRGDDPANICNRGRHHGVQLEVPRGLRDALGQDTEQLARFATAVRGALAALPADHP